MPQPRVTGFKPPRVLPAAWLLLLLLRPRRCTAPLPLFLCGKTVHTLSKQPRLSARPRCRPNVFQQIQWVVKRLSTLQSTPRRTPSEAAG
jgi:hypothetical protein